MSCCPVGSVIDTKSPPGVPSTMGRSVTFTLSPGLIVLFFQPARTRPAGAVISAFQSAWPPLPSGTSISIQEWGFAHLNCVMVPSTVTVFV